MNLFEIILLFIGFLFCNLITILLLVGIYNLVNAFIEDTTGTSLSEKIKEKLEHKNE